MLPSVSPTTADVRFIAAVREGLGHDGQKRIPAEFFYDEIGSALFDVITLLSEYGLTRADQRLLSRYADAVAEKVRRHTSIIELGSGSGSKTAPILRSLSRQQRGLDYFPIDVSVSALERCRLELSGIARVHPIRAAFIEGIQEALARIPRYDTALVLFLGSTIGNFDRDDAVGLLRNVRALLQRGSKLLLGADLVKPVAQLLLAYDDPAGVTAAFNMNLLARINRELGANFDLRCFRHLARYDEVEQRIEMHLEARTDQCAYVAAADCLVQMRAGETIWTESSHKYSLDDLDRMARLSGFRILETWTDNEWPFAESLWEAV